MRTVSIPILLLSAAISGPAAAQTELPMEHLPERVCLLQEPSRIEPPVVPDIEVGEIDRYAHLARRHRLSGRACYYSNFFDGRRTANGEIFRVTKFTAAHLTLPLGTWLEVRSLSTGRTIRVKVNDRGPYTGGFVIDLSPAAARELGVDRARDRRVEMKVLALPGEEPPPERDEDPQPEQLSQAAGSVTQNVEP